MTDLNLNSDLNLSSEHESRVQWAEIACGMVETKAKDMFGIKNADFYLVWFTFVLGDWKALVSSTNPDGRYYEITYNADKSEAYLDVYRKTHNVALFVDITPQEEKA